MGKITGTTGFTIIETMLFLAITGLMAVGILVGSGVAISQQRYRDSVNSLQTLLQEQYSGVRDVENDRSADWSCDSNGVVTKDLEGSGQVRGTADCLLLGRFVQVNDAGKTMTLADIIGVRKADAETATDDVTELKDNYTLTVSPVAQETKDVSWGATIVKPGTTTPQPLSMLVVRSPLSGAVLTFITTTLIPQAEVGTLVDTVNMQTAVPLCVDANTSAFMGQRLAVRIGAFAAGSSAVQIPPESDNVCGA
jgi:type II secretory pathway pseudopilin PulG